MLRYGKISELGTDEWLGYARVNFDELNIVSYWLSLPCFGSKEVKNWVSLPINTQVAVLMHPDNEQGKIIDAIWSDTDTPPEWANETTRGIEFPDGMKIYYNWNEKKLYISAENSIIEFNGGSLGGMVKVDALLSNIQERETRINAIVTALSSLAAAMSATNVTPVLGAALGAAITTAITPIITPIEPTLKIDIENTKITQ